jgi:hypothetical protein
VVALTGEQRWSSKSRAEVKTGSVVVRRGEMKRSSTGDADALDKEVEDSACGAVVTSGVW